MAGAVDDEGAVGGRVGEADDVLEDEEVAAVPPGDVAGAGVFVAAAYSQNVVKPWSGEQ